MALTYFVRSLGLKSSLNLTTGTFNLVVKDRSALRLGGTVFDFEHQSFCSVVLETCCLHCARKALETNLSNLLRAAALCQHVFALNFESAISIEHLAISLDLEAR
jgi:hypothetical protein